MWLRLTRATSQPINLYPFSKRFCRDLRFYRTMLIIRAKKARKSTERSTMTYTYAAKASARKSVAGAITFDFLL